MFFGFAPIGFEVGGGRLVVIVMYEIREDFVERFSFVCEGDVGAAPLSIASPTVGEEHDGDEMREVWLDIGIGKEPGNIYGKREV